LLGSHARPWKFTLWTLKVARRRCSSRQKVSRCSSIRDGPVTRDATRTALSRLQRKAGLAKIDFVLLTHYHVDHAGGVPQLFAKIPVGAFIDHGANREPGDRETEQSWEAYQKLVSSQHVTRIIAKVGDTLPIEGLRAEIVILTAH